MNWLEGKRILQIHDGGLAPGYTAVAVGLTEEAERYGALTWAANEGFRSLTEDFVENPRVIHLQLKGLEEGGRDEFYPNISMYGRIGEAGSMFRSERYPEFKQEEKQKQAAEFIVNMGFDAVIGIGGDGTLQGIKTLARWLPDSIRIGFVNVSVDSDIVGDVSIGYFTGAEEGARIARGLFMDGYTHKRVYILEMMGNRSGRHALISGVASRAHLVILPSLAPSDEVWEIVAKRLATERHGLIVVAEGFMKKQRKLAANVMNAAEYIKQKLAQGGLVDSPKKRVIAESFSRFIRGVQPIHLDRYYAYLKSHMLIKAIDEGENYIMPYFEGLNGVGLRSLNEVYSHNKIPREYLEVIDRLNIPELRQHVEDTLIE